MLYRVLLVDLLDKESLTKEFESESPRHAYEDAMRFLGIAPWKLNTRMDLDRSNSRRVIYETRSLSGELGYQGFIYPLEESA